MLPWFDSKVKTHERTFGWFPPPKPQNICNELIFSKGNQEFDGAPKLIQWGRSEKVSWNEAQNGKPWIPTNHAAGGAPTPAGLVDRVNLFPRLFL